MVLDKIYVNVIGNAGTCGRNYSAVGVFIDLKNTFDRNRYAHKLEHYGI